MEKENRIYLNGDDWLVKDYIGEDWVWRNSVQPGNRDHRFWKKGRVPGSVHYDLWQAGEIPDPYFERNSLLLEWIPARTWLYKKKFKIDEKYRGKRIQLHFKGVDYEARFYLNGVLLGEHKGMFTPVIFEVSEHLKYGAENLLAVVINRAPDEEPQVSKTRYVRNHKSRMTYWWDFCPRMIHLGIWDEVFLEITDDIRIDDVFVRPQLNEEMTKAYVSLETTLNSNKRKVVVVETRLKYRGEVVARNTTKHALVPGNTCLNTCLEIDKPALWWPNGYGNQPLYQAEVKVRLQDGKNVTDSTEVTFGIRKVEMVKNETEDETALPYTFKVNGRKIYIKGWNWVPIDVMYGVERPAKLKRLLTLARKANVNMLRVWGGGLIEKDSFYELCNKYGIMVWQEFIQSSSGIENKPSQDHDFIEMMVKEAEGIIPRKRNNPSLVLWCGGNELQDEKENPLDNKEPVLKALQRVVKKLDPDRYWLPTSPTGKYFGNSLENIEKDPLGLHDVHGPWEHQGLVEQYTLYNKTTSLLHSEFGVEGLTNLRTLNRTISQENQWPAVKENPVYFHLGAWWVNEPLVQESFGGIDKIKELVKASQFLQMEGLRYAVEANRRRKYQNSGTLPWQFNEPYPNAFCTAAIDYYARPKAVYYGVKKAYRPLHVSARFAGQIWNDKGKFTARVFGHNSYHNDKEGELTVEVIDIRGKSYYRTKEKVKLIANRATLLAVVEVSMKEIETDIFFLDLILRTKDGKRVDNRYLYSTSKDLAPMFKCPTTALDIKEERKSDSWQLIMKNKGKAAALLLSLEDRLELRTKGFCYFNDNYFTLFPGEEKILHVDWDNVPSEKRSLKISGWNIEEIIIE